MLQTAARGAHEAASIGSQLAAASLPQHPAESHRRPELTAADASVQAMAPPAARSVAGVQVVPVQQATQPALQLQKAGGFTGAPVARLQQPIRAVPQAKRPAQTDPSVSSQMHGSGRDGPRPASPATAAQVDRHVRSQQAQSDGMPYLVPRMLQRRSSAAQTAAHAQNAIAQATPYARPSDAGQHSRGIQVCWMEPACNAV